MIVRATLRYQLLPAALLVGLVAALPIAGAIEHPDHDRSKGWRPLFNGRDLDGWTTVTQDGLPAESDTWLVEKETLMRVGKAYLRTNEQFRDFVLDLEFQVAPAPGPQRTNSGVFLRHKPDAELVAQKKKYWWNGLIEIQLFDSYGLAPDKHQCGALYDMLAPSVIASKKPGEWDRMTITADGPRISILLNSQHVLEANLNDWSEAGKNPDGTTNKYRKPMNWLADQSGYIWLQDHPGEIRFRNIWIKSLDK